MLQPVVNRSVHGRMKRFRYCNPHASQKDSLLGDLVTGCQFVMPSADSMKTVYFHCDELV